MKRYFLLMTAALVIAVTAFSSCVKHPDPVKPDPTLDLTFKFQTRKDKTITVSAVNEVGNPASGILFSIYAENPYDEEGSRIADLKPIYQGYTETSGSVNVILPVPNSASALYVVPEFAGYGTMSVIDAGSEAATVELKGVQFPSGTKASMTSDESPIERGRTNCGNRYQFFRFYEVDVDYTPAFGVLEESSELVSTDLISNEIKDLMTEWFPEQGNYYDRYKNTDIVVSQDGTKVWMTFIGDGGYTNTNNTTHMLNSVLYYTYFNESELPNFSKVNFDQYMTTGAWNITYAFMNINPRYTACGTKVQLLYWNGEKYVEEFPAGVKIGFAFTKEGYGSDNKTPGFSLNQGILKTSTPYINVQKTNEAYAVILRSDEHDCYFMGMENAFGEDRDYNEAIMMIQTSAPVSQIDVQEIPGTETDVCCTYEGTLAFEDLWPYKGDYDFNDFVVDYKYSLYKIRHTNRIASVEMTFTPKALGATKDNGFGIDLAFASEPIIVYENTRSAFGNEPGCINTFPNLKHIESTPSTITVNLISPMEESLVPFSAFNPFIFSTENRGKEIHLVDFEPTSAADMTLFGQGDDKSFPEGGVYYRMDNRFPWALDIASTGLYTWKYPIEMVNIAEAYLHYSNWVSDHDASWFDWTQEGNAVLDKLY